MTRLEFMRALEGLLLDMPLEERMDALKYYEDYFEDAGPEAEKAIIAELVSPEAVAAVIKRDLAGEDHADEGSARSGLSGMVQEKPERVKDSGESGSSKSGENGSSRSGENGSSRSGENAGRRQSNVILIVLLCIFALPLGLPLLFTGFAIALSIILIILSLFLVFFVTGIALILGGMALGAAGIWQMFFYAPTGLVLLGSGLILSGSGFLLTAFGIWICGRVLPAFIKWIGSLFGGLFGGRRRRNAGV